MSFLGTPRAETIGRLKTHVARDMTKHTVEVPLGLQRSRARSSCEPFALDERSSARRWVTLSKMSKDFFRKGVPVVASSGMFGHLCGPMATFFVAAPIHQAGAVLGASLAFSAMSHCLATCAGWYLPMHVSAEKSPVCFAHLWI